MVERTTTPYDKTATMIQKILPRVLKNENSKVLFHLFLLFITKILHFSQGYDMITENVVSYDNTLQVTSLIWAGYNE